MRLFKALLIVSIFFTANYFNSASAAKKVVNKVNKKKSTDLSFEDLLVHGKYHFSDEAVTTVEDDKILDALLGIRKDFKDRIEKSASHH